MELTCPECAATLTLPDESAGRKARCPRCSAVFTATVAASGEASSAFDELPDVTAPREPAGGGASNPYAPTFGTPSAPSHPSGWAPRQISYEEVFSKSWAIFKEQWLMACLAILIVGGINFGLSMVQNVIIQVLTAANAEPAVVFVTQGILTIVGWVIQIWLTIGQTMVMLDIARGREVNLGKIFGGGPLLVKSALAMILLWLTIVTIVLTLIGIPAAVGGLASQAPEGALVGAGVGMLIAVVPLVMVSLMFSQFQILIVDRGLGPVESLRTSYEITNGNKLTLLVIFILMSVVAFVAIIAGLLALCVGVFPAMIGVGGFGGVLLAVTYLSMTGQAIVTERSFVQNSPAVQ